MSRRKYWILGLLGALSVGALAFAGRNLLSPKLTLGKDQREYLFTIEHHGLILGRVGFSRIAQAIKNGDPEGLLALFADGFEGEVLGQPHEARFEHDSTR